MAETKQEQTGAAATTEVSVFQGLLEGAFNVADRPEARNQVQRAVQTLAEQLLRDTVVVSDDALAVRACGLRVVAVAVKDSEVVVRHL